MGGLSAFMAANALPVENIKYVASARFVDAEKKPMEWELQCITSKEDEALRKACTTRVKGKRGQNAPETDYDLYLGKLAAACVVRPNLNDKELQDSYGVMGADNLLKAMLTPGEYADLLREIQEINGFDRTLADEVEEVKN